MPDALALQSARRSVRRELQREIQRHVIEPHIDAAIALYVAISSGSSVQESVSGAATRTSPRRSSLRPAIVCRLQDEVMRAPADPEVKQKLLVQGLEARDGSAAESGQIIDDETRKWSELIRVAGLKGE